MKALDLQLPFFNDLWRRVLLTVALLAWTVVEIASVNPFWAILFGALGLWCAWSFFFIWRGPYTDPPQD